jgi:hypothetical protein
MGEDVLLHAFDKKYHDRISDHIPGIDYDVFKSKYDQRNKLTLKNAMVTPMIVMLKEFCQRTIENSLSSPFAYTPKVILNVYPYQLEPDEIKLLADLISIRTAGLPDVEVINSKPEEVTPLYAKNHLSVMAMYRYDEWLDLHCASGAFERHIAPEVTLFGPRLYFKKPEGGAPEVDPFQDMEQLASPLVNLHLLPVSRFSMVIRANKKETA